MPELVTRAEKSTAKNIVKTIFKKGTLLFLSLILTLHLPLSNQVNQSYFNQAMAQEGQGKYQRGPYLASEAPKAPEWEVSEWVRGPASHLKDMQGKVVIIDFFQLWCPGCNKFSIPLMARWEKLFADEIKNDKLQLISIHTVFEGHQYQNVKRLRRYVEEKNFQHPVGVDRHQPGRRIPMTMERYRTRGTPEMAFIDKRGHIRFQTIGSFDPVWASRYIKSLLQEKNSKQARKLSN